MLELLQLKRTVIKWSNNLNKIFALVEANVAFCCNQIRIQIQMHIVSLSIFLYKSFLQLLSVLDLWICNYLSLLMFLQLSHKIGAYKLCECIHYSFGWTLSSCTINQEFVYVSKCATIQSVIDFFYHSECECAQNSCRLHASAHQVIFSWFLTRNCWWWWIKVISLQFTIRNYNNFRIVTEISLRHCALVHRLFDC